MDRIQSMGLRIQRRATWLYLDSIPLGRDVVLEYRKRAELCMSVVKTTVNSDIGKRAMAGWMFWMQQIHGIDEVRARKAIDEINS